MTNDDDPTLIALWASVAALPECRTRRGVLADRMMELGREDEAEAVRETAGVMPYKTRLQPYKYGYCFYLQSLRTRFKVSIQVWHRMRGQQDADSPSWKDYPTCLDALQDLVRATVEANRAGVAG